MKTQPRVSVGLPVYNGALFIEEAVASFLTQTFEDFELIIVDNASTDGTGAICRRLAAQDERIRYVCNASNIGAAANFNKAFHLSTGAYFKWAAADDVCLPEFLQRCVEILDTDPKAVLAFPDPQFINADGSELPYSDEHQAFIDGNGKKWYWRSADRYRLSISDPIARFEQILLRTYVCQEIFGLIRREALKGTRLIADYYGSDKVLLAELSLKGRLRRVPEVLFVRRCHSGQSGYKSAAERERWITGNSSRKVNFAQWKVLRGYARALSSSPLNAADKARGLTVLYRYVARTEKIMHHLGIRKNSAARFVGAPTDTIEQSDGSTCELPELTASQAVSADPAL